MAVIISKTVELTVGKAFKCKYPKNGTRNILVNREGTIEKVGNGPNGQYVTLAMKGGGFRTLSTKRMVDPQNA